MMDPITILTALLPAAADGVKTVINHFFGNKGNPQTVDDVVKLNDSEVSRLQALAALDKPTGEVHKWVNDVRAMQRPVAVLVAVVGFVAYPESTMWANLASSAVFYTFGDRGYMYLKQGGK
jgi:hypothetical protein